MLFNKNLLKNINVNNLSFINNTKKKMEFLYLIHFKTSIIQLSIIEVFNFTCKVYI